MLCSQDELGLDGMQEEDVSMKGIGYREFFPYFRGEATLEQVKEQIKTDTRHFAKRQAER